MSDEHERQLREVQAYFRLPSIGLVEKDREVVRAIAAVAAVDVSPFTLVFGGGTALARAHKIVRRMSEDVDFKIVPTAAAPSGRNARRRALARLRGQVCDALHGAGFVFDPKDKQAQHSQNEDRYTVSNQYPSYAEDTAGETGKALKALQTDPKHRWRYDDFVSAMVYGEKLEFSRAIKTVTDLGTLMIRSISGSARRRPH